MATKVQREKADALLTKAWEAEQTLCDSLRSASRLLGNPQFEHGAKNAYDAICNCDLHDINGYIAKMRGYAAGDIYHDEAT